MSYAEAQKKNEFWLAYYENSDERQTYNEPGITPQEFFEVWIHKDKIHEFNDDPNRSK
tara:strand:- start:1687 stop:1860 length:174 start_codon:yes stop_codon:yes gene_type:complete